MRFSREHLLVRGFLGGATGLSDAVSRLRFFVLLVRVYISFILQE